MTRTVAQRLASKQTTRTVHQSRLSSKRATRRGIDWSTVGIITGLAGLILFGIAWSVAMVWWLVWSILDLANGNPATGWNILGLILPSISILGSIARGASR